MSGGGAVLGGQSSKGDFCFKTNVRKVVCYTLTNNSLENSPCVPRQIEGNEGKKQ